MQPRVIIAKRHSSRARSEGQLPPRRPLSPGVTSVILAAVIGIAMTGCTSIYHRAEAHLPPELTTELSLRMAEAARAEQLTRQAGATLYDTLQTAPLAGRIQTDSDRLEAAAFDLERKVLAARDVAVKSGAPGGTDQELERLRAQSLAWLECAKDPRTADPAARIGRLQSLLEGSMPGAGSASESKRIQAH